MTTDMEQLVDEVWSSSLRRISSKEAPATRPSLGDEIDLYVPQERTLLLLEANPVLGSLVYNSSYASASRNAYVIMRKLNMPPDYFWEFEFWPRERAFDTLERVINRVFAAIMNQNREGLLALRDVDAEHSRFVISFAECAECAGISAATSICYYHSAMFAGIIAAMVNKEMDGYETECQATGSDACVFQIGARDDAEIAARLSDYLAPTRPEVRMDERLKSCLSGDPPRGMGNMVGIAYYQLLITNSIMTNPTLFSQSSFDVGLDYGTRLAGVLAAFYKDDQVEVIGKYYSQLRHLDVRAVEKGEDVEIVLSECAELTPALQKKELLGFLFGELQGLVSALLKQKMVHRESRFEDSDLRVRLSPEV